jgi:hypothetical protein
VPSTSLNRRTSKFQELEARIGIDAKHPGHTPADQVG